MQGQNTHFTGVRRRSGQVRLAETLTRHGLSRPVPSTAGFTIIELLVVVAIALVVAAFAVPTMTTTLDSVRSRGALNSVVNLTQKCRMQAIKSDLTQRLHITVYKTQVVLFVTDWNDANLVPKNGDPQLHAQFWMPQQFSTPGLPSGGPTQLTALAMWGSSVNPSNINVDVYFNSRGLPCLPAAGGACNGTNGFVYYFQYQGTGPARWMALSISPAGRIESWFWNGSKEGWWN